ncbi:hypothetical protein ACOMHN_019494 [Nucella lapillus]
MRPNVPKHPTPQSPFCKKSLGLQRTLNVLCRPRSLCWDQSDGTYRTCRSRMVECRLFSHTWSGRYRRILRVFLWGHLRVYPCT